MIISLQKSTEKLNLPVPKLIQPKQKLENRSCTKTCAKNEDLFNKKYGFLNGIITIIVCTYGNLQYVCRSVVSWLVGKGLQSSLFFCEEKCDKTYFHFFHYSDRILLQMTWTAAKCYCEQMDMRLSSVETAEKLQCVENAQKSKFLCFYKFHTTTLYFRLVIARNFLDKRDRFECDW